MIRVDETDPVGEVEPSFPYRDVTIRRGVDFKDHYDIQLEIGRGKFGTVYHCKEKTSGLLLAAKVVTTTRKEDRRSVEREVEIMRRLQHPRLIQLYDAIDTGKQIYVILELIQGGELFERVIDDDFVLTERSCAVFMRQICEGIEFVHAQHILHLDMKPENILCLTKEGNRIKIIDFGLARHYDPRKKMQVLFGTPEFVAPEVVNFDQIGFGTDMWSIGVICYVLLSGLSPFMGDTDVETMANVTIAKYDFDHDAFGDISEDAKDFIRCLLVKDKEKRATATQCRSHRWLVPKKSPVARKASKVTETKRTKPGRNEKAETQRSSGSKNELDVTKDNLRLFVERWREHPNSPYSLDTETRPEGREGCATSMTTTDGNNLESISLRGQSPSPCGSVCSTWSDISEANPVENNNMLAVVPNSMMRGLERRASEGNNANSRHPHRRDQAAQIVLAEEIIKLSEHLRNLATGRSAAQTEPAAAAAAAAAARPVGETTSAESMENGLEENSAEVKPGRIDSDTGSRNSKTGKPRYRLPPPDDSNEISEKLSTITRRRRINGTTFNGSRNYGRSCGDSVTASSLGKSLAKQPRPDETEPPSNDDEEIAGGKSGGNAGGDSRRIEREEEDRLEGQASNEEHEMDLIPPWRRQRRRSSRTIHRFGETCRDVPRISNLRDIHKNLNLDEPQSAKDLLLHLLGELDDTGRTGTIGRKSVSVDWGGEESVARRSIDSLAEYFQSERQRTTPSSVIANDPQSSVHR